MLDNLRDYKILLASKSPRRRELLQMLRIPFHVITLGGIDESYPDDIATDDIPAYLAEKKGAAYLQNFHDNELIITADTLVILEDEVLGKPKDYDRAVEMLKKLSGKTHKVITGVSITSKLKRTTFSSITKVKFAELSDDIIDYYVENYLPYDKAGAYGIQEWIGCVAVESIDGSFYNVMGLPVHQLYKELRSF